MTNGFAIRYFRLEKEKEKGTLKTRPEIAEGARTAPEKYAFCS